ncbi:MAG: hypothetical protein B6D46_04730 [Polyangiaceae bacterium UTPRO1]|jgi:protein TonB|nr:energy transducer TonB [Myxococcales bacterium]OQY67984.1 MAG: hypothetical protein B6D46_04730 [Polyangiaceae bacterium UTPRO1]
MGSAVSWVRSFGVSIAIHALLLAVLYDRTVRVIADSSLHTLVPVRVIWSEPAPAAVVPAAAAVAAASAPEAAVPREPVSPPRPEPPPRPVRGRTASPAPRPRAAPPPPGASAAEAATGMAGAPAAAAGGGSGEAGAGAAEAPLALAAVAHPPELVERILPEYPARARALELEGRVLLEIVLDREGRPEPDIRVRRSQPPFDAAAIAAVRQWRFRPARDGAGRPVRVIMEIPVRFELR